MIIFISTLSEPLISPGTILLVSTYHCCSIALVDIPMMQIPSNIKLPANSSQVFQDLSFAWMFFKQSVMLIFPPPIHVTLQQDGPATTSSCDSSNMLMMIPVRMDGHARSGWYNTHVKQVFQLLWALFFMTRTTPSHPNQSGFRMYHQVLSMTSKLGMLVSFFIIDMYRTAALYSTSIGFLYQSRNSNCD